MNIENRRVAGQRRGEFHGNLESSLAVGDSRGVREAVQRVNQIRIQAEAESVCDQW